MGMASQTICVLPRALPTCALLLPVHLRLRRATSPLAMAWAVDQRLDLETTSATRAILAHQVRRTIP